MSKVSDQLISFESVKEITRINMFLMFSDQVIYLLERKFGFFSNLLNR